MTQLQKTVQDKLPASVVKAQLYNDWSKLSEEDRLKAALALCRALDIPTPLNPFRFITMNGKVVLYAPNEAAQLIAESKGASVNITNKYLDKETNIYTVEVRVSTATRTIDNMACLYVGGLTGQKRADAMMKAVTKASRRTIFAAFGLSVTDDDDIEAQRTQGPATGVLPPTTGQVQQGEPETLPPADQEAEDLKALLYQQLIGKEGKFSKNTKAARSWIEENCGKKFDDLDANDANELLAKLENEKDDLDLDAEMPPPPKEDPKQTEAEF